jgi:hypothetical protein
MEVDVPGSVKGVWAETGVTDPLGGDETRYMALVDYPYRPQQELALSHGPDALGARLAIVPRETSGRVNRAFESVTDDRIYCYGPGVRPSSATSSWFVEKTSDTALRIEWVTHPGGASPCGEDPESWQFSAAAVAMVR